MLAAKLEPSSQTRKSKLQFVQIPVNYLSALTATELKVYAGFSSFAHLKTRKTIVSTETVARLIDIHPDTVKLALRRLGTLGIIKSRKRGMGKTAERTVSDGGISSPSEGENLPPEKENQIERKESIPQHRDFYRVPRQCLKEGQP